MDRMSSTSLGHQYEAIHLENIEHEDDEEPRRSHDRATSQYSLIENDTSNQDQARDNSNLPFTRIQSDWWTRQMLVDRSLRGMAALTAVFAVALYIVIFSNAKTFAERWNPYSTSIGVKVQGCKNVQYANMAILFLINIAATMVLGMSNTYQQLVAALKVEDLRHALEKFGDSRVGTNSPFTINHKRTGKLRSWMGWLLLIITSMPVHLLVNSLVGPSYIYNADMKIVVDLNSTTFGYIGSGSYTPDGVKDICWSAFRVGQIVVDIPHDELSQLFATMQDYDAGYASYYGDYMSQGLEMLPGQVRQPQDIVVYYSGSCSDFAGQASGLSDISDELADYAKGNCSLLTGSYSGSSVGENIVTCKFQDPVDTQCRLNIRMLAAFFLAAALTIKAVYMIVVNFRARGSIKTVCLTFGDVLVAAAADPSLRTLNECMVNASDHYRYQVAHSCHKHCQDKTESRTGDELGHCQRCTKFNHINKSPNLEQPRTATKMKRSLVSLLGGTTLPQLILLSICSAGLFSISVIMAVGVSSDVSFYEKNCQLMGHTVLPRFCEGTKLQKIYLVSGGWQSRVIGEFSPDSITKEFLAMIVANSAQTFYSFIYLLLIYNITLVSQEYAWGKLEHERGRLRCTIDRGHRFEESYLIQLPKKILFPIMAYSVLIHWLLGECLQMKEYVWRSENPMSEHSRYVIAYSMYPVWVTTALILFMTSICWWAYSFKRQGFIPQMYGSIRVCCAAASELDQFSDEGIMWGDLGEGKKFRHAGFSSSQVDKIHPHELYAGRGVGITDRTKVKYKTEADKL